MQYPSEALEKIKMAIQINKDGNKKNELSISNSPNKSFPYELHWRKNRKALQVIENDDVDSQNLEADDCVKRINLIYAHNYIHLMDMHTCMQCGAIPCPYDHDIKKDEGLKDLKFIVDVCEEKKRIELAYQELKKQIAERDEKELNWVAEKYLITNRLSELEIDKEKWITDSKQMKEEIKNLKLINDKYRNKITDLEIDSLKITSLSQRLQAAEKELSEVEGERTKYRELIVSQSNQLVDSAKELELITAKYEITKIKANQYDQIVAEFNLQINDLNKTLSIKQCEIDNSINEKSILQDKLNELHRLCEHKDAELIIQTSALREEMIDLQNILKGARYLEGELKEEIVELQDSITRLQSRLASDSRFRAYIDLKKSHDNVKENNRMLLDVVGELANDESYDGYEKKYPINNTDSTLKFGGILVRTADGRISSARGRLRQTPNMIVTTLTNIQNEDSKDTTERKIRSERSQINYSRSKPDTSYNDTHRRIIRNNNLYQLSSSQRLSKYPSEFIIKC